MQITYSIRVFVSLLAVFVVTMPAIASKLPPDPVEALVTMTPELLTTSRAPARVQKFAPVLVETDGGSLPMIVDDMADLGSACRTLKEAFPTLPLCREWPPNAEIPRFPFAIDANERLVDALDKMRENSGGAVDWALLHGRIVLTTESISSTVMDRSVAVNITADTLLEALEQIEASYNDRYSEYPFAVCPATPRLMLKTCPETDERPGQFILRTDESLREVVLAIMDQLGDAGVCYGLSDVTDSQGRRYFLLHPSKVDAPELATFVDGAEAAQYDSMLEHMKERLESYFAANAEKAAQASEQATGGDGAP